MIESLVKPLIRPLIRPLVSAPAFASGVVFTDDFNRADNADIGSDWNEDQGDFEILSNQLQANTGASTLCVANAVQEFGVNHYAQVEYIGISGGSLQYAGVVVRCDGSNGYAASYAATAGPTVNRNRWTIWKKTGASFVSLATEASTSTAPSGGEIIKLVADGDNLTLTVDDVEILTTTDSTYTNTRAGVIAQINTVGTRTVTFDNFEAGDN